MKQEITRLLRLNLSFNNVESLWLNGRITEKTWLAWVRVWEWLSPKFGGNPGLRHEIFWEKFGQDAYFRRINKVRVAFGFEPIAFK